MDTKFERVALKDLRQGRRGKHDELVMSILNELCAVPEGEAIKVPRSVMKGVSIQKIRAAVARAASSRGLKVATYADTEGFFVWNRTKKTAQYERVIKGR